MIWIALLALGGIGALIAANRRITSADNGVETKPGSGVTGAEGYAVDAQRPYGPRWRGQRPPGLPERSRRCGKVGTADPYIRQAVMNVRGTDSFLEAVLRLSENESGRMMGRPANTFDARSPTPGAGGVIAARPPDNALITAWGCFQYNRDAWRRLPGTSSSSFPWESTAQDEAERPVREFWRVWQQAKSAGAPNGYAERAIRLYQIAPAEVNSFISRGALGNWVVAWREVRYVTASGRSARDIIDSKLMA